MESPCVGMAGTEAILQGVNRVIKKLVVLGKHRFVCAFEWLQRETGWIRPDLFENGLNMEALTHLPSHIKFKAGTQGGVGIAYFTETRRVGSQSAVCGKVGGGEFDEAHLRRHGCGRI